MQPWDSTFKLMSVIRSHVPSIAEWQKTENIIAQAEADGMDGERLERLLANMLATGLNYGNWPWTDLHQHVRDALDGAVYTLYVIECFDDTDGPLSGCVIGEYPTIEQAHARVPEVAARWEPVPEDDPCTVVLFLLEPEEDDPGRPYVENGHDRGDEGWREYDVPGALEQACEVGMSGHLRPVTLIIGRTTREDKTR